jgi:hypothetical protein
MDDQRSPLKAATSRPWLPLTFAGVAAFSQTSTSRVWLVTTLGALLWGGFIARAIHVAWWPALAVAVSRLPDTAEIRDGELRWPGNGAELLVDNSFLAITVSTSPRGLSGLSADVQITLRHRHAEAASLLGYVRLPYPEQDHLNLSRGELEPLWAALQPHLLVLLWLLGGLLLPFVWFVLAIAAALPLWWWARLLRRELTLPGSWRVAAVAFVPATAVVAAAVTLYSSRRIGLVEFLVISALHLPVVAAYLVGSTPFLNKRATGSPFAKPAKAKRSKNPFAEKGRTR